MVTLQYIMHLITLLIYLVRVGGGASKLETPFWCLDTQRPCGTDVQALGTWYLAGIDRFVETIYDIL